MSKQLTEEKIRAASDTIDAFLDSLSTEDKGNQEKALSKFIRFLIDERIRMEKLESEMEDE